MGPARSLFASTIFPLTLTVCIWVTIWLMEERGMAPATTFVLSTTATYFLLLVLQRLIPVYEGWQRSHGDVRVDLAHLVVSGASARTHERPCSGASMPCTTARPSTTS